MVFRSLSVHGGPSFPGLVAIVNLALLGPSSGRPEFVQRVTAASTSTSANPFYLSFHFHLSRAPLVVHSTRPLRDSLTHSLTHSLAAARLPVTPPPSNVYTRWRKKDCIIEETVARERELYSVGAWCGYPTDEEIHRLDFLAWLYLLKEKFAR